jgi:hypothetical protein
MTSNERWRPHAERGRPNTRDETRPEPHKAITRHVTPRGMPAMTDERATQPVRPRGGPPRPRGVR